MNILFSYAEIKYLKKQIIKKKSYTNDKEDLSLDGFYKALSNIEKKNRKSQTAKVIK